MPWKGTVLITRQYNAQTLWLINNVHSYFYRYGTKFMDEYQSIMTKKLGLPKYNKQLISKLLNNMAVDKVDYTNFFRLLSNVKADPSISEDELLVPLKAVLLDIGKERKEAWISWLQTYIQEVPSIHKWDFVTKDNLDSHSIFTNCFLGMCVIFFLCFWPISADYRLSYFFGIRKIFPKIK